MECEKNKNKNIRWHWGLEAWRQVTLGFTLGLLYYEGDSIYTEV